MALRGRLELASHTLINGWAWETDEPDTPVSVVVSVNDEVVARCLASRFRTDLIKNGIGDGRHMFQLRLATPLSPLKRHVVAVRREGDGKHIPRSPLVIEAATSLDEATRATIAQLVTAVGDDADLSVRLTFVDGLAGQLRQAHADRQSDKEGRASRSRQGRQGAAAIADAPHDRPRALVIDERMPLSNRDAGSNAILSHMEALRRLGYDVSFVPADLRGDSAELEAAGVACCQRPWYGSVEEVLARQRGSFALVYLHRVTVASRYLGLARHHQPKARILYSVADLHHMRLAGQAAVEDRPDLRRSSERVRLEELTAAWQADAVVTHSTTEAAQLHRHMPAAKVHVVPWHVPPRPTAVSFAERQGFAFIGGYGHGPNVDAALWLVDHVVPAVAAQGAAIPCLLVGSDMPDRLRALRRDGIDPVGHVPALATLFDRVRLTVAPLAYGAGVKGKVLDSLAAGVPCVCTPAAADGLDLPPLLLAQVAGTADDLARCIRDLHEDAALNLACRDVGLAYVAARLGLAQVDERLRAACGLPLDGGRI